MTKEEALEIIYISIDQMDAMRYSSKKRPALIEEVRINLAKLRDGLERKNSVLRKELNDSLC